MRQLSYNGRFLVCLVEISSGEETTRVTKFARSLLKMLTNSDESVMRLASRAIAYLIQVASLLWYLTFSKSFRHREHTQSN